MGLADVVSGTEDIFVEIDRYAIARGCNRLLSYSMGLILEAKGGWLQAGNFAIFF